MPVEVNRVAGRCPRYCGPHTLVVCSSYSGDTAETLAAFREAVARGLPRARGDVGRHARRRGAPSAGIAVVRVPGGFQPRAALGHLGFASLGALETDGAPAAARPATSTEAVAELDAVLADARARTSRPRTTPRRSSRRRIGDRVPVIWGADGIGSVAAARWKTQMNENGKVPAFWSSMSGARSQRGGGLDGAVRRAVLRGGAPSRRRGPELAARFPLSYDIVRDAGGEVEEVRARGHVRARAADVARHHRRLHQRVPRDRPRRRSRRRSPVIERLKAALAGS